MKRTVLWVLAVALVSMVAVDAFQLGTKTTAGMRRTVFWVLAIALLAIVAVVAVKLRPRTTRGTRRLGITLVAIVAVVGFALGFLITKGDEWYSVPSGSMSPTITPGAHVLVDTTAYASSSPAIGDIVIFRPSTAQQCAAPVPSVIARIVAVGGDTISSRGNRLLVNGHVLVQNWPHVAQIFRPVALQTVPSRHAFMMGDNEPLSCDSRYYGAIAYSEIVGKVISIQQSEFYWPL
jgi:signal peptidase I